ncbi:MAG TPA: hypothetical protein DEA08_04420, partial [Planctomycetes bacterium]|nr:hypothetical protein [Planctomycetota bacterium]
PQGFAIRHLGWEEDAVRRFRRHLLWLAPVALFATVLVVAMDVQVQDSSWNDSLGRLGFALGTCALAAFCALTLRPSGKIVGPYLERNPGGLLYRARYLWYASAVGLPLFFVGLALRGFYYTATSLLGRLSASFSLVLLLMVAHAVLRLWLESAHARRVEAHEAAMREREKKLRRSTVDGLPPPEDEDDFEEEELEDEVGRLFRAGVALALLFGLWGIWADVLPALRRLERIQVYPSVEVLSAEDEVQTYPALEGTVLDEGGARAKKKPAEGEEPAGEAKGDAVVLDPTAALQPGVPDSSPTTALPKRVTLADVGLGLLLVLFTVIATRSLPALLELILLQRLPLDAGARYAFTSVARYVIIFLGSSVALGTIGIGWSNLQWLAAALTFGLGFGLQEIFANFVSGLIILFERPVRVGDVITIGGVTGTVTRLRMRATTIRHLDNRELIVPNRQLVTGDVINWSLSDPTIRIELPVGVAYGSDTLRVRRLLVQIARRDHQVLRRPRPRALFLGFGGSSLDFELRVYIAHPLQRYDVLDRLHHAVDRAFREEGVEISFPQQDLHIRSLGPLEALAEQATGLTEARRAEAARLEAERLEAEAARAEAAAGAGEAGAGEAGAGEAGAGEASPSAAASSDAASADSPGEGASLGKG